MAHTKLNGFSEQHHAGIHYYLNLMDATRIGK